MHNPAPHAGPAALPATARQRSGSWASSCLTAGCIFLMWLGEQIDEYGLGNGISLDHPRRHRRPHAQRDHPARRADRLQRQRRPGKHRSTLGKIVFLIALVRLRRRRLDPDHAGAAPHPDPAGQAHPRPARLRRAEAVPPAPREPRRRHADHLRPVADALPRRAVRLAATAGQRRRQHGFFGNIVQFLNNEFSRGGVHLHHDRDRR